MTQTTAYFPTHTRDSAPVAARPALDRIKASVGMVPNLAGAMSESPVLIDAFATLRQSLAESGSFSAAEGEAISLVNAVENGCSYCTAIHSTLGSSAGLDDDTIRAIRAGRGPTEGRLGALLSFARLVVSTRGHVPAAGFDSFFEAGFSPGQALEIIARLALSVMANYSGHFTAPEPDEGIRAWVPASA